MIHGSRFEELNRSRSGIMAGEIVIIRYSDHVLFSNADPNLCKPIVRECVGWILKETNEAVWVLWDRSVEPLSHERIRTEESGLVLLKSEILRMNRLE